MALEGAPKRIPSANSVTLSQSTALQPPPFNLPVISTSQYLPSPPIRTPDESQQLVHDDAAHHITISNISTYSAYQSLQPPLLNSPANFLLPLHSSLINKLALHPPLLDSLANFIPPIHRSFISKTALVPNPMGNTLKHIPKLSPEPPPYLIGVVDTTPKVLFKKSHGRSVPVIKRVTIHHSRELRQAAFILYDSECVRDQVAHSTGIPRSLHSSQPFPHSRKSYRAPPLSQAPIHVALSIQQSDPPPFKGQSTNVVSSHQYTNPTLFRTPFTAFRPLVTSASSCIILVFILLRLCAQPSASISAFALICIISVLFVCAQFPGLCNVSYVFPALLLVRGTNLQLPQASVAHPSLSLRFFVSALLLKAPYQSPLSQAVFSRIGSSNTTPGYHKELFPSLVVCSLRFCFSGFGLSSCSLLCSQNHYLEDPFISHPVPHRFPSFRTRSTAIFKHLLITLSAHSHNAKLLSTFPIFPCHI